MATGSVRRSGRQAWRRVIRRAIARRPYELSGAATNPPVSMELGMRLFASGLRKLVRRPATFVSLGLLAGLLSLILIAVGATARQAASRPNGAEALLLITFPRAYTLILSFILGLGSMITL